MVTWYNSIGKGLVPNERLEVDLFLPNLKTAIEIDGPSHFFPIWGEEHLARNLRSDSQKTGLLITRGFAILRVKHLAKHISTKHMRDLSNRIIEELEQIKLGFPKEDERLIEIEV
jgi:very-short-patch-repair endonuclease